MQTKGNSKKKNLIFLGVTILVFLASALICSTVQTSGFSVEARDVNFMTDDGVMMAGTLYIPKNATADTPAPGILVAPGGNTPHVFYQSYSSEFARRGYVVFAYDYYGAGKSEFTPNAPDQGALAAMKYLTGLSFVDTDRLAATGHSNGGGQAFAAITSPYAANATTRSVLFIGCGIAGDDMSVYDNINVGAVWATYDEAGQGTFWDTYHQDRLNLGAFPALVGMDTADIAFDTWYGDAAAGTGRILYAPNTFHSLSNIVPSSVTHIIDFIDTTLAGNTTSLAPSQHLYLWNELFTLVAAIALCAMFFPLGGLLLETPFFSKLKRPLPEATATYNWKFWVFLLIPTVIMALIVKPTIMQGQTLLGNLPNVFKVQSTNGFIWWFTLASCITIAFLVLRMFVDKDFDRKAAVDRLRTTPMNLLRAILFALVVVWIPYLFSVLGERIFGQYGRIFQTYLSSMTPERLAQFPIYFVLYGVMFFVFAYTQVDALRIKNGSSAGHYLLTLLANALPALLFLAYIFGTLVLTHATPIDGREMSRANGAMLGMMLLYFIIAKVVTYFYKKSGNVYVCALINAAFVVWLSINTPQLII